MAKEKPAQLPGRTGEIIMAETLRLGCSWLNAGERSECGCLPMVAVAQLPTRLRRCTIATSRALYVCAMQNSDVNFVVYVILVWCSVRALP